MSNYFTHSCQCLHFFYRIVQNSEDSEQFSDVIPITSIPLEDNSSTKDEGKDGKSVVKVKSFSKNSEGKKIWDKKHYCLYCVTSRMQNCLDI